MSTIPNHVRNVWKINHIPKDKVQYVLDKITMISGGNRIIDFDLIKPEPRYKKDCPEYEQNYITQRDTGIDILPSM